MDGMMPYPQARGVMRLRAKSHGFELVDTGGTAKLYRITACD